MEKNPTIVTFPIKNLDMAPYVDQDALRRRERALPTEDAVASMGVRELREVGAKYGAETGDVVEKADLTSRVQDAVRARRATLTTKYDLVCNICHDSPADSNKDARKNPIEEGSYRCHVLARVRGGRRGPALPGTGSGLIPCTHLARARRPRGSGTRSRTCTCRRRCPSSSACPSPT